MNPGKALFSVCGGVGFRWRVGILTLFVAVLSTDFARAFELCEVCRLTKAGNFYILKNKFYKRDFLICKSCHDLDDRCDICRLPVLTNAGLRLADRRVFCPEHAKTVVMDENKAADIFAQSKDEVMDLVRQYPPLPHLNIKFHLVTREDFVREYRRTPGIDDPYQLLGLTITRPDKEQKLQHDIYVVHGLTEETFLATCAHEYAHAWHNERETPTRQLHKDTREGLCEWLSHKVVAKRGLKSEMARIEESTYTRGQVNAFLAAEKEYSFYKLVRWITDGVDSWIDGDKLQRVLVWRDGSQEAEEPAATVNWVQAKAPPAPQKLLLKGLSGAGARRFALINDATLGMGEEGKVRIGASNVIVRCISIQDNSVRVQVRGENSPRTLQLGQK